MFLLEWWACFHNLLHCCCCLFISNKQPLLLVTFEYRHTSFMLSLCSLKRLLVFFGPDFSSESHACLFLSIFLHSEERSLLVSDFGRSWTQHAEDNTSWLIAYSRGYSWSLGIFTVGGFGKASTTEITSRTGVCLSSRNLSGERFSAALANHHQGCK